MTGKNNRLLFSGIVMVVLATVWLYREVGPARQAQRVVELLELGAQGYTKGKTVNQACPERGDHMRIFCFEGFFIHKTLWELNRHQPDSVVIENLVNKSKLELKDMSPTEHATWAVAFGIAYGKAGWNLRFATKAFLKKPEVLAKYFVDGWAVSSSEKIGANAVLTQVKTAFGSRFLTAGAWGLGRASFFDVPKNMESLGSDSKVVAGFDFAKAFTRNRRLSWQQIKNSSFSVKIAEISKKIIMKDGRVLTEISPALAQCMIQRHISECAGIH